jgi:DNA-binding transcriptional ArsR family regulator
MTDEQPRTPCPQPAPPTGQDRSPGRRRGPRPVASLPKPRELTDPMTMRALAHPVRIRLLELLIRSGELTATEAAEELGESPANCSFHLRTLARYGFVEEAPRRGGRRRPWRAATLGVTFDEQAGELALAGAELLRVETGRLHERHLTWLATSPSYPAEWRSAAIEHSGLVYLTPDELTEIGRAVSELLAPFTSRLTDPVRPAGSAPVQFAFSAFPVPPTRAGN